jgi:hypothetical protein
MSKTQEVSKKGFIFVQSFRENNNFFGQKPTQKVITISKL